MLQKIRWFGFFLLFSVILAAATTQSFAEFRNAPLESERAFRVTATLSQSTILTEWQVAPGYYLYKKHFQFVLTPATDISAVYPPSQFKLDQEQTKKEVYAGRFVIPLSVGATKPDTAQLHVVYQGCSKRGFCYPPMSKDFTIHFAQQTITESNAAHLNDSIQYKNLMTNQNDVKLLLDSKQFGVMVMFFLGIGLLLAFTPCVLPMIPILTSIVVGQRQPASTGKAFMLSAIYVFGSALTYALAGVAAASLGESLQVWLQQSWIIVAGATIFVLLAFSLFGFYELRLPNAWQNRLTQLSHRQRGGTYLGVLIMGVLSTLIVSPCVTAPLVGTLMFISHTGNIWFGATALFAMGIGMGIPLLLIGMSAGRWLPRAGRWMEVVKTFFGVVMLAMAIWILSRILPSQVIELLTVLLLVSIAIYVARHLPQLFGYHFAHRALAFLIGLVAVMIMVGDIVRPTLIQAIWPRTMNLSDSVFVTIHSVTELDQQLAAASAANKPVIVDFYADWCESCVAMDKNVFASPEVQRKLHNYVLLRADLSHTTSEVMVLLKKLAVIAPPAVLFFDPYGNESDRERIIGEVTAVEFLKRLDLFAEANCGKKTQC